MNKKVTIRDVAAAAGVAVSSVHQALNGKSGVSSTTRARICKIADALGYQPNAMASGLKRKTRRIAVLLPGIHGNARYFYPPLWNGVRDYLGTATDMNLEWVVLDYPLEDNPSPTIIRQLREMVMEKKLDGLLTVGHMNALTPQDWETLQESGVTVVLLMSNDAFPGCLCCVQPDYDVVGRTMAELIISHIPQDSDIFVCAGNPDRLAHSLIVQGMERFLAENQARNRLILEHSWNVEESSYQKILHVLSRTDVAACCSVLSQSSVLLGRALEESGKAGRIFAVGSDLAEPNIDRLNRKIFHNLIQKNPYAQGYLGMKTLAEFLTQGKRPENNILNVGSEVVFRSNLSMYRYGSGRTLLL
ncbi:MAG: substrate-binding domain-containing protein [Lawsonibacter sp.]|nr:substrate-binding domain-containing protein [Lawsonibacter sp.]